jgi:hypothetical protein
MPFLDRPDVDIYFSTWNKTVYVSPKINLYRQESVTEEIIVTDLGFNPYRIIIDNPNFFPDKKYNSKMINRWVTGFKMIVDSGVNYDYVIIIRPDMYYGGNVDFNSLVDLGESLGVIWPDSMIEGKLSDVVMASSFRIMKHLIGSMSPSDWINSNVSDWHIWWHDYCKSKVDITSLSDEFGKCVFYRCIVPDGVTNYDDVLTYQNDWRDLKLLHKVDFLGRELSLKNWPPEVLTEAESKWALNYFDKYKKQQ